MLTATLGRQSAFFVNVPIGALGLAVLSTIATVRGESLIHAGVPNLEALTSGFSWVFLGAAVIAVGGATVAGLSGGQQH